MEASFLEIYNESIKVGCTRGGQLATPEEAMNLTYEVEFTDPKSPHTHVTNLKVVGVRERSEIYVLLRTAQQHRAVAATSRNEASSRSHSIFRMVLSGSHANTGTVTQGASTWLTWLGSERQKESGLLSARLTETQNINKSLSNLGNVIMALGQKQHHVPYRNPKLTHVLQPSLGGNSKTLMLVNICPLDACINETFNSLHFASMVNACHVGTARKIRK